MKRWIIASLLVGSLVGAVALAGYEDSRANSAASVVKAPVPGSKTIEWAPDFETAMRRAKAEQKPLFVAFETKTCTFCKQMNRTTYVDPAVISEMNRWVAVKIDGETRNDVAQAYGVTGFPTVIMAQGSGKPFGMQDGYIEAGEFQGILRKAFGDYEKLGA